VRYRSRRPDDAPIRARLRELAAIRRRFGYRRLHILLVREGLFMNHKKFRRLYREEGLQVRRRSGRKRAVGCRAPITIPQGPNQRWSLDFALSDGRRFRILAIVDDFTRECLALIADTSLPGLRVVRELDFLMPCAAVRPCAFPITALSSPAWPSCAGHRSASSSGIISRPASRSRTPSSRAWLGDELLNETLFVSLAS